MIQRTEAKQYQRINVALPEETLSLLDRVVEKGSRSMVINKAVRRYLNEIGLANLRKQLRA